MLPRHTVSHGTQYIIYDSRPFVKGFFNFSARFLKKAAAVHPPPENLPKRPRGDRRTRPPMTARWSGGGPESPSVAAEQSRCAFDPPRCPFQTQSDLHRRDHRTGVLPSSRLFPLFNEAVF